MPDVHGGDAWARRDMPVGFEIQATELISVVFFVLRPSSIVYLCVLLGAARTWIFVCVDDRNTYILINAK